MRRELLHVIILKRNSITKLFGVKPSVHYQCTSTKTKKNILYVIGETALKKLFHHRLPGLSTQNINTQCLKNKSELISVICGEA